MDAKLYQLSNIERKLRKALQPLSRWYPLSCTRTKKSVQISSFVDANVISNVVTGRSCTGILHLFSKTPIEYFSKSQTSVERAAYVRLMNQTDMIYTEMLKRRYIQVYQYLQRQCTDERSTYGSEFIVMKTAVEMIKACRYK